MKILYLCPDAGIPVLGRKGASVHVRELCRAFHRAGHQVALAAQTLNKSPWETPAETDAKVIQVKLPNGATDAAQAVKEFNATLGRENSLPGELRRVLFNAALVTDLTRRFEHDRPDFIYERASLYATAGATLAKRFGVPHLVELNAPLAVEQSAYRATSFGDLAAQAERWMLNQADGVVVVSSELAKHVRALGVKPAKIHVMPNGVNTELFHPKGTGRGLGAASTSANGAPHGVSATQQHTSRCGLKPARQRNGEPPVLGFVGGLRPWHGVEILPELLARVSRRHPGARLVIAGDGPLRGELEAGFRRRSLAARVDFTGTLPHEDVPTVIRRFDVALAPYPKHAHDFYFSPLKLYEYMACGVPVVAAKLGQIAETVRHRETGWLYAPGNVTALADGCARLLADAPLRQRLGAAAAKLVHTKFTWDHNAARVVKLARQLARG